MKKNVLIIVLSLSLILTMFLNVPVYASGNIALNKTEFTIGEKGQATVTGIVGGDDSWGIWIGIALEGARPENTDFYKYFDELPSNNVFEFEAPLRLGKYEVRLLDEDNNLIAKDFFAVIAPTAKPGDITLSNTKVKLNEAMSVTVKGLTKKHLENGAWLGISKWDEKLENTNFASYIQDLPMDNTYKFNAPDNPGKYEVRVFSDSDDSPFGKAEFIVGETAVVEPPENNEGPAPWAAEEVNEAKEQNLVTDKVMVNFPEDITREEFCELAVLLYEKLTGTKATTVSTNPFNDTTNPEILKAYGLEIVGGIGNCKFAPKNKVTRQEISAMLFRTVKAAIPTLDIKAEFKTNFNDKNEIAPWALESVKFMNANDIVKGSTLSNGTSYIRPKGNTTKQEAILMVLRIFKTFDKM